MSLNREAVQQQISAIAFDAWLGTENRQLIQSERLDNACRIIDTVIAALIRTPGFLQSDTYGSLLVLGNRSSFPIIAGNGHLYEINFMPIWEGQQLELMGDGRKVHVDTTIITHGYPDALIEYTGQGESSLPNSTNAVKKGVNLVREFETDLKEWTVPESSQAA